jgi:hypothetical protein
MRGNNITNVYKLDSNEFTFNQLSQSQILYIEANKNLENYNNLRNKIIYHKGDQFECVIKIEFPLQIMNVFDKSGLELFF